MAVNGNYEALIQQLTTAIGSAATGSSSSYYGNNLGNLLNGSLSKGSVAGAGNGFWNESGIKSIVNLIVNIVTSATNESSKAKDEAVKHSNNANETLSQEQTFEQKLNRQIKDLGGNINVLNQSLIDATVTLTERQNELKNKEEQVNTLLANIASAQEQLKNSKNPKEQAELLTQIQGYSGQLAELISSVTDLKTIVADLSTQVNKIYTEIEVVKGNVTSVQEDGEQTLVNLVQKTNEQVANAIETGTVAVTNEATATAAATAAGVASTNPYTATKAPKLLEVSADNASAAIIRTTDVGSTLKNLQQGIGRIKDNSELLSSFNTAIGSALTTFDGLVGAWNSTINPMLVSIGSWDTLSTQKTQLDTAITNDLSKVTIADAPKESEDIKLAQNPRSSYTFSNNESSNFVYAGSQQTSISVDNVTEFETPNVKLNQFSI